MIVHEMKGFDDLGQDWLGPLVTAVAQTGLAVYKTVAEQQAAKKAARAEEAAAAQAAAAAASAALQQQQQVAQQQQGVAQQRAPSGMPTWGWIAIAGAGVIGLGFVGYLLLRHPAPQAV